MNIRNQKIAYQDTHSFSNIVLDYIHNAPSLHKYYTHVPSVSSLHDAILQKKISTNTRHTLVTVLKQQYKAITLTSEVAHNIDALLLNNTYTVCTAHQPNICTGHLYFVYKIAHTIQLARTLAASYPSYNFVPVYYMGTEDADKEELNNITIHGQQLVWHTTQQGAFGSMVVDEQLIGLINSVAALLQHEPHTQELVAALKAAYTLHTTISDATRVLVHSLFGTHGLVILDGNDAMLKAQYKHVLIAEITHQASHNIVNSTSAELATIYKAQAHSRPINLFYLQPNSRERILLQADGTYAINNTSLVYTQAQLLNAIEATPECYSPNVILRGLYQETILPNIAYIGGGGELAYWLQLKALFAHYNVPLPVLILRNSILLQSHKVATQWHALGLGVAQLFEPLHHLEQQYISLHTKHTLNTAAARKDIETIYRNISNNAVAIAPTLEKHVLALLKKQLNKLIILDKKLLHAEKRNWANDLNRIRKIKALLFPNNTLQERADNLLPYYAQYGKAIIPMLIAESEAISNRFTIITLPEQKITNNPT